MLNLARNECVSLDLR